MGGALSSLDRLYCMYMYVCMYIKIYLLCMIKVRVRWCTCSL